nr:hypothetical protein [Tanacetum cinerariifolium]
LIVGNPIVVVPSTFNELDDNDQAKTMKETSRLAGSEEVIHIPDVNQSFESKEAKDIRDSVKASVLKISSPTCVSKPKLDHLAFTPLESSKPLDEKTSRILERLETPRKLKSKLASPVIKSSSALVDSCMLTKRPLIPFQLA